MRPRVPTSIDMSPRFEPTKPEATDEQTPAEDAKPAKKQKAEKPEATDAK